MSDDTHHLGSPALSPRHAVEASVQVLNRDAQDRRAGRSRQEAHDRAELAVARDALADARDESAERRDAVADLRDARLEARDAAREDRERTVADAGRGLNVAVGRTSGAAARAEAAAARLVAAQDRRRSADDRRRASHDRTEAERDRRAMLELLATADTDVLTGARARGPGLAELELEIDRARRDGQPIAAAYVDVVGLKGVNDTLGHGAGDRLLCGVVRAIRSHSRSYDLVIRLGGDEFLCVMSGATIRQARSRFTAVQATLLAGPEGGMIRVGFAALQPDDETAGELVRRADEELPAGSRR